MIAVPLIAAAVGGGGALAAGAGAATALGVASAVGTVGSAVVSAKAASDQAKLASKQGAVAGQVADYNAKLDEANAAQLALDAHANIQRQRQDNSTYLSSQRAAYAASGVLSGTGSPMIVQATTAGRMEEDVQNYWRQTQQRESNLYAAGQMERFGGANQAAAAEAQAQAYRLKAVSSIFDGIGGVAKIAGGLATESRINAEANNPYGTSTFRDYKPWAGWDNPSSAMGGIA